MMYSTDASVYQERPIAVSIPQTESDLQEIIRFARKNQLGLIPRGAGTSLAGQVVGGGMVVDMGRHFTEVLEVNGPQQWVRVQPGVIRDDLNRTLKPYGLMFGPETSTANRAMIGGMLGNNSCGSNSIVYGSTRDCTLEVQGYLSDGSQVTFGAVDGNELERLVQLDSLEGQIYRGVHDLLSPPAVQDQIMAACPKPSIHRRNTGYALDQLMDCRAFGRSKRPFNFCQLIAGSEGTLMLVTEIKLKLVPLPPPVNGLLCVHFSSVRQALEANVMAMKHSVFASELIDHLVLEGAQRNRQQRDNLSFIVGEPAAILVVEFRGADQDAVQRQADALRLELQSRKLGEAFPLLFDEQVDNVWQVRKAGLGVLANVVGDEKPVTVIEDTAVDIEDLPDYISEVDQLLREKYQRPCAYYAHAGSGEIHMRPVLNLKSEQGVQDFRAIASDVAELVKKYRGSLSGEHGDGRLRGEWIEGQVGSECYQWFRRVKELFDPQNLFNPGKIIDAPSMTEALRYRGQSPTDLPETVFDFSDSGGVLRAAELCSGSGDCRKPSAAGGTMCPSYMATRKETDSTRARANVLRQVLMEPDGNENPLSRDELMSVMDLCLSCKACKSECPSNVDMAKLKSETLQAHYDANGTPRWATRVAQIERWSRIATRIPWLMNRLMGRGWLGRRVRSWMGIAADRELPAFASQNLHAWFEQHRPHENAGQNGVVHFFFDEFTSYTEPQVGIAAIELLEILGWRVERVSHRESGRASISSGLLRRARDIAGENVQRLGPHVSESTPLISVEPSAILTFRDDYPSLLRGEMQQRARRLAKACWTFEEFMDRQIRQGRVSAQAFTNQPRTIRLHGHCHEKALIGLAPSVRTLQLPAKYRVRLIPSGCCGMAGSFGYQKEHHALSLQIGEMVLFPTLREEPSTSLIAAAGTSCRHQIRDGVGRVALHPAQILRSAVLDS